MANSPNIPGNVVLNLFDQIVDRVKQTRPANTSGKPLDNDFCYSQMILGMPIAKEDFAAPWSPSGGTPLPSPGTGAAPVAGTATSAPAAGTATAVAPPVVDPAIARSLQAAYKTAQLCNVMLQVSADDSYIEYPVGRHLAFQYEMILNGMQPGPMPTIAPDIQKQIDDAKKVLYVADPDTPDDPTAIIPSGVYARYKRNAQRYADAKTSYTAAFAASKSDPTQAQLWPMMSSSYRNAMDDAWNTLKTEGADEVERALAVIESVGIPMQDAEIAKARQLYDKYSVDTSGVGDTVPYSYISPSAWCDPDRDDIGFQRLVVSSKSSSSFDASSFSRGNSGSWKQDSSSTGGSGGVSIGFAAFGASGGKDSSSGQWAGSSNYSFSNAFGNTAKDLEIDLEYALCTIVRPWLISDLFYMNNWYLASNDKSSISTGTAHDQLGDSKHLLPMIAQQFLVIRNVKVSSTDWGSDGDVLGSYYGQSQGSSDSSSSHVAGSGGVCLGFVNFGGTASHSQSHEDGQHSSSATRTGSSYYGTTFENNVLSIGGAQILAFVSDIVPQSPPLPDPELAAATQTPVAAGALK